MSEKRRVCSCEYGNCHLCRQDAIWGKAIKAQTTKPTKKREGIEGEGTL